MHYDGSILVVLQEPPRRGIIAGRPGELGFKRLENPSQKPPGSSSLPQSLPSYSLPNSLPLLLLELHLRRPLPKIRWKRVEAVVPPPRPQKAPPLELRCRCTLDHISECWFVHSITSPTTQHVSSIFPPLPIGLSASWPWGPRSVFLWHSATMHR